MLVVVLDSHFSTILFRTQEECTIIIIILVRMEAFYSSTCISILLVFEFLFLKKDYYHYYYHVLDHYTCQNGDILFINLYKYTTCFLILNFVS